MDYRVPRNPADELAFPGDSAGLDESSGLLLGKGSLVDGRMVMRERDRVIPPRNNDGEN